MRSKVSRPGPRDRAWSLSIYACVLGAICLVLAAAFAVFGNTGNIRNGQQQLEQEWDGPGLGGLGEAVAGGLVAPPKPLPGNAVARITLTRLNQSWIVVEGVAEKDIANAPGHYSFSQMPGQKGNFAVAGHRSIGLFWDLDKVRAGDEIKVETKTKIFTYVVTRNFITAPDSWPEVSATPPGFQVGNKVLTLTTCNPKWDNYQRLVVHAVLKG